MNRLAPPAATLATALLAAACGRAADRSDAPPSAAAKANPDHVVVDSGQRERFRIERSDSSTFFPSVITTGTVAFSGDRSTQVLAPISGPVSRILVTPGARVERGQPLAIVASPDFAAAVAAWRRADATARNAQRIAELDQQLFKNDALARRELEQAETDAAAAAADRDAALEQLHALGLDSAAVTAVREGRSAYAAQGVIRAPISGTLVEKLITPGQLLQAGSTPCFTVADLATVWVMANVFERDIRDVRKGEKAMVVTGAAPDSLPGAVDYVAALVDPATKATAVRLVVPNRREFLKRDMLVQVVIRSALPRKGLLVPVSAVLRDDENLPYLFIAMPDRSFLRRRIELGGRVADRYEVTSGLTAGEHVVVDGGLYLQTMAGR
ncbi:MAG: efflux RND transporter periplasmic adaptor subunit [Gemmatimonadetes bacterium]|nr:MAG: efflux RND transporter periplasmic adaptor subunit [Gemmatimonadota bacterium]